MKINDKQLAQVNDRIKALIASNSFYGKKLEDAGISEVCSAEDFEKLPFSEVERRSTVFCIGLEILQEYGENGGGGKKDKTRN